MLLLYYIIYINNCTEEATEMAANWLCECLFQSCGKQFGYKNKKY